MRVGMLLIVAEVFSFLDRRLRTRERCMYPIDGFLGKLRVNHPCVGTKTGGPRAWKGNPSVVENSSDIGHCEDWTQRKREGVSKAYVKGLGKSSHTGRTAGGFKHPRLPKKKLSTRPVRNPMSVSGVWSSESSLQIRLMSQSVEG